MTHDYSRKSGVETAFVLAPSEAPAWASERNALWNAAEGAEGRKNSVVARYGVAVDVAVHASHREGDDRNWHAHLYTTTREVGADGFGAKTRVLDGARTGRGEILAMRAVWAEAQNQAYRDAGIDASVDHRSLEAQCDDALQRGDVVLAKVLDREPEPRLEVAATNVERRAAREAAAKGREYAPVTERGQAVVAIRAIRYEVEMVLADWKGVRDRAASAYETAREEGVGRIGAAIEAIRAVREPQGREEEALGDSSAGRERDGAEERVRAAEGKLKEEDLREEQAEKLAIERNSRGRGFER